MFAHTFSHPDYTVGYGITPYHATPDGSQTILPVGNLTLPRRYYSVVAGDQGSLNTIILARYARGVNRNQ